MPELGLSIVLTTIRQNPGFQAFFESLRQAKSPGIPFQVIVVDAQLWYLPSREKQLRDAAGDFYRWHLKPKKTPWQGPLRYTQADLWAASSARNTGWRLARYSYVVFSDDCQTVPENYLTAYAEMARQGRVACGSYTPGDGRLTNGEVNYCSSNCGAPFEDLCEIQGFDEIFDGGGNGLEDTQLGVRLERLTGEDIVWMPDVCVLRNMALEAGPTPDYCGHDQTPKRHVKGYPVEDASGKRFWHGMNFCPAVWWLQQEPERILPYGLVSWTHDWRDGQPLSEMKDSRVSLEMDVEIICWLEGGPSTERIEKGLERIEKRP